jgi:chemotaxis protein MotA
VKAAHLWGADLKYFRLPLEHKQKRGRDMDLTTILGVVAGFILVIFGIQRGGAAKSFIDFSSVLITIGGSLSATIISFRKEDIRKVIKIASIAFRERSMDYIGIIEQLITLADLARREGLLALDNALGEIEDDFLKRGLQLVVDGIDPEIIKDILETGIGEIGERHKMGRKLFDQMALFAPAFGMIGTLIGLIQMLRTLDDPSKIGPGMAVALVTTFYGAVLAYLVFIPLSSKLAVRSQEEVLHKAIILEGILAIQSGDNPRIVSEKLKSYLPSSEKDSVEYVRMPAPTREEVESIL